MTSVIELLQTLVRIPSVNPDENPAVSPGGEEQLALAVQEFLTPLGFETRLEEVEPGRPNLIARAPGPQDRPRLLLAPHLDTVGIDGMTIEPFAATVSEGKVHGRGTSDTKGPMAAMLWGLAENADRLASLPVAVDFVAFMGEESSQPGSRHFASRYADQYAFAIAGEPTSLKAVHCTKGSLWATLQATGKSAHASRPQLGENAILKLIEGIRALQEGPFHALLSRSTHPVLGFSTMNVGTIRGGTVPNIVPDEARAVIDIRTVPELVQERLACEILADFIDPLEIIKASESPPMSLDPDHPWLQQLAAAVPNLELTGAPWFSDATHLAAAGIPSICLGPGSIDQAHTADEFIAVADLEDGARWFTRMITSLRAPGSPT